MRRHAKSSTSWRRYPDLNQPSRFNHVPCFRQHCLVLLSLLASYLMDRAERSKKRSVTHELPCVHRQRGIREDLTGFPQGHVLDREDGKPNRGVGLHRVGSYRSDWRGAWFSRNKLRAHARHIAAISNDIFDRDVTRHMDIFHISEIDEMPLSHRVVFCDNAQNLTRDQLILLSGKVKEGAELILIGDPDRCVNPGAQGVFTKLISAIERGEIDWQLHRIDTKNTAETDQLRASLQ